MSQDILLVDDDPVLLEVLSTVLDLEEFTVVTADDGERALAAVARHQPQVVVCDVAMPGIDGFEVCRRLKADPATAHLPVVLLTADGGPQERQAGLDVGCDASLTKPFSPLELIQRLREVTASATDRTR